jgi:hypothetical protein
MQLLGFMIETAISRLSPEQEPISHLHVEGVSNSGHPIPNKHEDDKNASEQYVSCEML